MFRLLFKLTAQSVLFLSVFEPACRAITVATVGDSFADAIYDGMHSRPDLLRKYGVQLKRWSRPIVGLTRTDYFDYTGWLGQARDLGTADLCFVQIGSNDMQSMPVSKGRWIAYSSEKWKQAYVSRAREMFRILQDQHCGQVAWVLQPGFEQRELMACHRELINRLQGEAVRLAGGRVLDILTNDKAYGPDRTHFNRTYVLQLGQALFRLVGASSQIIRGQCLSCHSIRAPQEIAVEADIFPLRLSQATLIALAAAPELECPIAPVPAANPRRVRSTRPVHRARADRAWFGG